MKLRAVIGANYGDEGKGLLTDYLCAGHPDSLVVRFNGGAQAGHTVVTPEGYRHVFSHFGAGTLAGAATYLSRFFIVHPGLWEKESRMLGIFKPKVTVHPDAYVSTPWDALYNRALEVGRGAARHGSCGLGVWETELRHRAGVVTQVKHIVDGSIAWRVDEVKEYFRDRTDWSELPESWDDPSTKQGFLQSCVHLALHTRLSATLPPAENIVFEGAQGLLLDECNEENFPHVSGSRTGIANVLTIYCEQNLSVKELEPIYVTRSYLTRHGPGPFPTEDQTMHFRDDTNHFNTWQRDLRFGMLDRELEARIQADAGELNASIAVTHLDQCPLRAFEEYDEFDKVYFSAGPTRSTIVVR